jgi:hypothetical protein
LHYGKDDETNYRQEHRLAASETRPKAESGQRKNHTDNSAAPERDEGMAGGGQGQRSKPCGLFVGTPAAGIEEGKS